MNVRIKYEATRTVYTMSAHVSGAATATLHARAEIENAFTDINVKVSKDSAELWLSCWAVRTNFINISGLRNLHEVIVSIEYSVRMTNQGNFGIKI